MIAEGWTKPARLAALGASAGGITVGRALRCSTPWAHAKTRAGCRDCPADDFRRWDEVRSDSVILNNRVSSFATPPRRRKSFGAIDSCAIYGR